MTLGQPVAGKIVLNEKDLEWSSQRLYETEDEQEARELYEEGKITEAEYKLVKSEADFMASDGYLEQDLNAGLDHLVAEPEPDLSADLLAYAASRGGNG